MITCQRISNWDLIRHNSSWYSLTPVQSHKAYCSAFLLIGLVLVLAGYGRAQNGAQVVAASALKASPVQCEDVTSVTQCHRSYAAGCSKSAKPTYDAYLAYFKNQIPTVLPESQGFLTLSDFASLYTRTPEGMTTNNHATYSQELLDLHEGQYFTTIGYLYYALINEGGEACNCALEKNPPASDYHIGIGFDAQLAQTAPSAPSSGPEHETLERNSIIVEMTPHYRARYHPNWTYDLVMSLRGKQVKVVGQLILDNDHAKSSDICSTPPDSSDAAKCWRESPWELHPVTEFYVCRAHTCDAESSDWVALDDAESQGLGSSSSSSASGGSRDGAGRRKKKD
jgi:hypothetical protein